MDTQKIQKTPGSLLRPCVICNERSELVHKFPTDTAKAKKWVESITMNGSNPISKFADLPIEEIKKKFLICYRHFKKSDYKNPISRSLNITAIPAINLRDMSQLHLCKEMEAETVRVLPHHTIEQKIINSPAIAPQIGTTINVFDENKNEPESYFVYENESIELITTQSTTPVIEQQSPPKNQSVRTRRRESVQEVRKDVKRTKVELVPLLQQKPTIVSYENRATRTLDKSFSETKDCTELTPQGQEPNSNLAIQKIEPTISNSENSNKLLALFEVTPEQYKILSNKLSSSKENDAVFNFTEEGDENLFKNYEASGQLTTIKLNKNKMIEVDPLWLRDQCTCKNCYNVSTKKKQFKITEIPDDIAVLSSEYLDNYVFVKWNDGHLSKYCCKFLEEFNFEHYQQQGDPEQAILWNTETIMEKPAQVDYRDYLCDDDVAKKVIKSLINYGVAFIVKVPTNAQQTEFVIRKLFPIQKTLFGEMRVFQENEETDESMGHHTKNTFFNDAAGLHILHCLALKGSDEKISLVDGFNVADKICQQSPPTFQRLCNTKVAHEFTEDGKHHKHVAPIIKIDSITKKIEQIRYNLYNRAPMDRLPMNLIRQHYNDLKDFTKEVENCENHFSVSLNPGTVMILDNWRILYSNNSNGKKSMAGCYVSRTEYLSIARTMGLIK